VIGGFYAVVDDEGLCADVLRGGARVVQMRVKEASTRALIDLGRRLRAITRGQATFIVNDRADVALLCDADGVHVGQDDLPLGVARKLMGTRLVGVSTHSLAQAREAARGGADYIGFGPVFPTRTKDRPDPVTGVDALRIVCADVGIPVVAIGGITPDNVGQVVAAGAVAAVSMAAVNTAPDVASAAGAMAGAFARSPSRSP
jgi:thiamine-phosphate pyrophosphorylase